jgi:hypothetical protein
MLFHKYGCHHFNDDSYGFYSRYGARKTSRFVSAPVDSAFQNKISWIVSLDC